MELFQPPLGQVFSQLGFGMQTLESSQPERCSAWGRLTSLLSPNTSNELLQLRPPHPVQYRHSFLRNPARHSGVIVSMKKKINNPIRPGEMGGGSSNQAHHGGGGGGSCIKNAPTCVIIATNFSAHLKCCSGVRLYPPKAIALFIRLIQMPFLHEAICHHLLR